MILCGVGGNGVVLTTRIIAESAIKEGIKVRVGEVHGLAMRGGTVVSHLRLENDAKGMQIPQRRGDILLAFEPLEALRQMKSLKRGAKVILNNEPFVGVDAHLGLSNYPDVGEIIKILEESQDLVDIDATYLAVKAGNVVMTNIVMLGALSASEEMPIRRSTLLETVKKNVPKVMIDSNVKAFEYGEQAFREWKERKKGSVQNPRCQV